jgi:deoxyribonuclease IV
LEITSSAKTNRRVGIHVSIAGKLDLCVDRAKEVGCVGSFQIFTCSPRRWNASPLKDEEVAAYRKKSAGFEVFAHMPYMPNLASPDKPFYEQSVDVLIREIKRCDQLGVPSLVLHFGSHRGTSVEEGHEKVIEACKKSIKATSDAKVRLLLENSAGVRNSVGSDFAFVKKVLDRIDDEGRVGSCLDTCHAFASGYDLRSEKTADVTISEFDQTVGIRRLYLIHVNDSRGKMGDGLDRHENIGKGEIGLAGFRAFLSDKRLRNVPLVLETPIDKEGDDKRNLQTVKKLVGV